MSAARVVVVGQIARDLALRVDEVPGPSGTTPVLERREMLGGKGANQAVALCQLGTAAAVVGVVGDDPEGDRVLAQAAEDGIDVRGVVRRRGARTGLIVDVVDRRARWRYLEDLPDEVLVHPDDLSGALAVLGPPRALLVQLQQPPATCVTAAEVARAQGAPVFLDGALPPGEPGERLLRAATVWRADAEEAALSLRGMPSVGSAGDPPGAAEGAALAADIARRGPELVVVGVGREGNALAGSWGREVVPLTPAEVVDPTGAGDVFMAVLTTAVLRGLAPVEAVRRASAAAGGTTEHLGGRPDLDPF